MDDEAGAAILDIDLSHFCKSLLFSDHTSLEQVNMTLLLQLPTENSER